MVKTNFFNGVKMPSIAIWDSKTNDIDIIKEFSYEDFENKLS
jgi:carboxynorspermidine decarboxylase